ncbi:hypothetical protein ACV07N_12840 [Roseivirga echinicomitans]
MKENQKSGTEKKRSSNLMLPILLALSLGLAPFTPEPHIWGKLKWVIGGASGMQPMDYFDLLLHGAPWVYLVVVLVKHFKKP